MTKIIRLLIEKIRGAATYNPESQVAPFCIIWPDKDRQWEATIPLIQKEFPELMMLGAYDVENRTGPAIWLRYIVSGFDKEVPSMDGKPPVLYLPGVSRQELRAVESCPDHLKAIAELQYRGAFWSQLSSRDWTIFAFFSSSLGGLGLDIAQDNDTKNALSLAVSRLLDEDVESLQHKRLDKDFFNELVSGKDVTKDLLLWMDDSTRFKLSRDENAWKAFIEICNSKYEFNPEKAGSIEAAKLLALHKGSWATVWERFIEAPSRYPHIPDLIKKVNPPDFDLFLNIESVEGWPQWNDIEEKEVLRRFKIIEDSPSHTIRETIFELEERHGIRRGFVWAQLGFSPLAKVLEPLSKLSRLTEKELSSSSIKDLEEGYRNTGWEADNQMLNVLAIKTSDEIRQTIFKITQAVYEPWANSCAQKLQNLVKKEGYPGDKDKQIDQKYVDGTCLVFVDGLRFDVSKRLKQLLEQNGKEVEEFFFWTALPSNTITGKATVSPVSHLLDGSGEPKEFTPGVSDTSYSLKGGYHLRKLLKDNGWQVLEKLETGDTRGLAWCEVGNLDQEGHNRGWKLAQHLDALLMEIKERVLSLIDAGWRIVRIVTDHGWIILPKGLPKANLASYLTETQSGRYALLKLSSHSEIMTTPWYWDDSLDVALAPGIHCFRSGDEYQHGGLSLQECLTLQLIITKKETLKDVFDGTLEVFWKGLRCNVVAEGDVFGLNLDIRLEPGLKSTSVVYDIKQFKDDGTASVVVDNEDLEGKAASLLLVDANGNVAYQMDTIIGG